VRRAWLTAFLLSVSTGCYVYPPVVTAPAPGTELRLDLDDRGRAGLGSLIGPSAASVQGVLQTVPDTAYMLKVTSVVYMNGQSNRWNGEQVTVPKVFVANTRERKFSQSRTYLTAAGVVAGVAGFIVSRVLHGSGSDADNGNGGGGGNEDR
jgi:predicted ATP-grasp superfamily ATP-dependent carboligase